MPKTKLQEVVFTILMVFVMVYAMICYNITLNMGGMSNIVFLNAFHELVIMGPIAFILDFFLYGSLSKKLAFRIVSPYCNAPSVPGSLNSFHGYRLDGCFRSASGTFLSDNSNLIPRQDQ